MRLAFQLLFLPVFSLLAGAEDHWAYLPPVNPDILVQEGESNLSRPSMGSWISYGLGSENENLPSYVSMCPGGMPIKRTENWRSSFLPGSYQGTYLDSSIDQLDQMIENLKKTSARDPRQAKQLDLLRQLNGRHLAGNDYDPQQSSICSGSITRS